MSYPRSNSFTASLLHHSDDLNSGPSDSASGGRDDLDDQYGHRASIPLGNHAFQHPTQPVLDELRREEEEAQRERRSSISQSGSSRGRARSTNSAVIDMDHGDPTAAAAGSYVPPNVVLPAAQPSINGSSGHTPEDENKLGDIRAESFSIYNFSQLAADNSLRQALNGPSNIFGKSLSNGSHRLSITPNAPSSLNGKSASSASASASAAAPLSPTPESPNARSSPSVEVSATDIERSVLTDPAANDDGPPGPLLMDYQKSSSNIRKDFTTVDWFYSKSVMRRVRRLMRDANRNLGWKGRLKNMFLAGQGWLILAAVGVMTAISASVIHSVSAWLSDLKGGYCSGHNFFATKRVCCMDEQLPGTTCQAWSPWSTNYGAEYVLYVIFATIFGTLGSWVCVVYARQAAGSGIAELKVILGGFILKKFLGIRTLFFKTIGLTLAVGSGMALGKEGPMVHIACAWGNILSRPFLKYGTNEVKKREVLSAAAAAGVTAAFGSPIGGVLFSLEVVSSYFPPKVMWRSFWCAICTALVLQSIDPFQTGRLVQFAVSITVWRWFELVPIAFIGAVGGIMGALFIKLNIKFTQLRKGSRWLRSRPVFEVFILCLITAIINFPNIFMRGNMGALLAQLFSNCSSLDVTADDDQNQGSNSVINALCDDTSAGTNMGLLLSAFLLKLFLTTMTYGSSIPSGVFMPSLVSGALFGRLIGWLMYQWHQAIGDTFIFRNCDKSNCINPALYAVVGAASVLGGITRMTVSLAVIMFEVTGGLDIIVPIMVGVVLSKWFGDAFGKASLYGQLIELNGLPHIDPHEELDLVNPAADFLTPDPICLTTYGQTVASIQEILDNEVFHGFPILDNPHDRLVTGFIARSDLEFEMEKLMSNQVDAARADITRVHFSREPPPFPAPNFVDFSNSVDKYPIQVRPSMPVDRIMGQFQALGLRYILCCTPRGRLLGIIKKKDLLVWLMSKHVHHK